MRRLALLAAALLLAACTHHGSPGGGSNPDNAAESEAVKQALAKLPGVQRVDGGYNKNASDPGSVNLSITVEPGTAVDPVITAALKQIWLSHLAPCRGAVITAGPAGDFTAGVTHNYDFTKQGTELTKLYGPRPAS
jgi:hypothetical protein